MNYTIRRGDTLSALAARFNTSVSALARANGIRNVNLIYAGANLKVDSFQPANKPAPAKKPSGGGAAPVSSGGKLTASQTMQRLAANARGVAMGMGGYNSQGLCATGVSRTILKTMGIKVWGNGNQIDNNLPRNKFKQVNLSLAEALKIPGLVLTWEKTSSRLGSIYGHTAITTGDGRSSISDFIERNTLGAGGRSGFKVFQPI